MAKLNLAPGLKLDPDYVGAGTFALLAKKGAGKSYTARVMAEEFWEAGIPFVLIDPMGTQWGLRSSADGEQEGIPVAIFGGAHGDAPLERTSGVLMADLVMDEGLSMILDMSELGTRGAERRFAQDFLDRLYRRNKSLVHVLMDEADLFAPQKPQQGDKELLGITENIVRRGRNRGIGITLITQRPAVLNKDVLTQVDGLVAMRIVGLTDRKAIDEWLSGHGDDPAQAATVKGTLAGLENGECWWWIPELGILKRVQVRESRTYDSSPSSKRGAERRDPKSFADVDMGAIGDRMAETIERAKNEDPKELRATIRKLEADVQEAYNDGLGEGGRLAEAEPVEVRVPYIPDELVKAILDLDSLDGVARNIIGQLEIIQRDGAKLKTVLRELPAGGDDTQSPSPAGRSGAIRKPPPAVADAGRPRVASPPGASPPRPAGGNGMAHPSNLGGAKQTVLDALAALDAIGLRQPGRTQVALFAKQSPKSSGFEKKLSTLRTAGLIDYPGQGLVCLTVEGAAVANSDGAPASVAEMHEYVARLVGQAKWTLLATLIRMYPTAITREMLAEETGQSASSSGFEKKLSTLRSLGLLDYPGSGLVVATPVLFLEAQ